MTPTVEREHVFRQDIFQNRKIGRSCVNSRIRECFEHVEKSRKSVMPVFQKDKTFNTTKKFRPYYVNTVKFGYFKNNNNNKKVTKTIDHKKIYASFLQRFSKV